MASRPSITIQEYRTPPDGTDARHAVSVTNLTNAEARQIAVFVRELGRASEARERAERMERAEAVTVSQLTGSWKPPPNEEMAALDYAAYERERYAAYERERGVSIARTVREADERQRATYLAAMMQDMSGDAMDDAVRDAARQPEPTDVDAAEEPPNRFSGLDFE